MHARRSSRCMACTCLCRRTKRILLLSVYHTATGLMGGEYQHLCYLNMGRGTGLVAALRSRTSKHRVSTSVGSSALSWASFSALRPVMMRLYPPSANLRAQASPIQLVAPVINAIFFILVYIFCYVDAKLRDFLYDKRNRRKNVELV